MAYRFKLGEPVGKGVRRIALEQLDRARASLDGGMEPALAVHDARKCLKRSRALLRLVRPALGERDFKLHAHRLRDIAQLLSGARDAHVARLTLAALEHNRPFADAGDLAPLRSALAGEDGAEQAPNLSPESLQQALDALGEARDAIASIEIEGRGFDPLGRGLARSFFEFHAALDAIHPASHDEDFHELRKHAQIHWRHVLLLRRAWPEWAAARAALARSVSDRLGEDHDLSVLRARAGTVDLAPSLLAVLETAIAERQAVLRDRALVEARRLAIDKPKGLARRLAGYWRGARKMRTLTAQEKQAREAPPPRAEPARRGARKKSAPIEIADTSGHRRSSAAPRRSRRRPTVTA